MHRHGKTYVGNPKEQTWKLLELISNMWEYKVNIKKSVMFIYTSSNNWENNFQTTHNSIKYQIFSDEFDLTVRPVH